MTLSNMKTFKIEEILEKNTNKEENKKKPPECTETLYTPRPFATDIHTACYGSCCCGMPSYFSPTSPYIQIPHEYWGGRQYTYLGSRISGPAPSNPISGIEEDGECDVYIGKDDAVCSNEPDLDGYGCYMRMRRRRAIFSTVQLQTMKKEFEIKRYLSSQERQEIAREINVGEKQIKIWWQNRRNKDKNIIQKNECMIEKEDINLEKDS
uniref:Brain-specific homeobox protein homolog (Trinotate prediction) n=1 Tax=Myxobolus squamalis TaxID=59785 RepID=A0A6B2G010_MYXSQ